MVGEGVPTVNLMTFFLTLFVGPLENEIHVFSDGLSEND